MMKKVCLTLLLALVVGGVHAQDYIVLTNGNVIKAKVVKIEGDKISYQNYDIKDGPVLVIFSRDVLSINYEDGTVKSFSSTPTSAPKQQPAQTVATSTTQNFNNNQGETCLSGVVAFNYSKEMLLFQMNYEHVHMLSNLFISPGVGFKGTSIFDLKSTSYALAVPLYLGYLFGDWHEFNLTIRGGVVWNYIVSAKYADERIDLNETKRSSWNGSVRVSVGLGGTALMAQYDFPFNTNTDGTWYFGLNYQLPIQR